MAGQRIVPVLLCGGVGARMWPVSRETMPKQFAALVGHRSTFQHTLEQVGDAGLFTRPIVITHRDFRFIVAEQMRELGIEADIVLEPLRCGSGLAVAVAAELAARRSPDATVLVLATDHIARKPDAFLTACRSAAVAAADRHIVTLGIVPTAPATRYAYIRSGAALDGATAYAIEAFIEKPDAAAAGRYWAEGYLWNSGNYMFRADVMRDEFERFAPAMARAAREAVCGLARGPDFQSLAIEPLRHAPKTSIDHAVMERTSLAAVVPADMGWCDIGSWDALWHDLDHDAQGNALSGATVMLESRDSLVRADAGHLAAVVGLDAVVVIATEDAVLVASRHKTEQVKLLVETLKEQNRREAVRHRRVDQPWGSCRTVDTGPRHRVRHIAVHPGAALSPREHFKGAAHLVVVRGIAEVTLGNGVHHVHENESIESPIDGIPRLANPGKIELELIAVQAGSDPGAR